MQKRRLNCKLLEEIGRGRRDGTIRTSLAFLERTSGRGARGVTDKSRRAAEGEGPSEKDCRQRGESRQGGGGGEKSKIRKGACRFCGII